MAAIVRLMQVHAKRLRMPESVAEKRTWFGQTSQAYLDRTIIDTTL